MVELETKWYVLCKESQFKIAMLTQEGALQFHKDGWKLGQHPYSTRNEAETAMTNWRENLKWGNSK